MPADRPDSTPRPTVAAAARSSSSKHFRCYVVEKQQARGNRERNQDSSTTGDPSHAHSRLPARPAWNITMSSAFHPLEFIDYAVARWRPRPRHRGGGARYRHPAESRSSQPVHGHRQRHHRAARGKRSAHLHCCEPGISGVPQNLRAVRLKRQPVRRGERGSSDCSKEPAQSKHSSDGCSRSESRRRPSCCKSR